MCVFVGDVVIKQSPCLVQCIQRACVVCVSLFVRMCVCVRVLCVRGKW